MEHRKSRESQIGEWESGLRPRKIEKPADGRGKKRQKGDQVKAEKLKKQNVTGHILGACRSIVRSGSARSVRL